MLSVPDEQIPVIEKYFGDYRSFLSSSPIDEVLFTVNDRLIEDGLTPDQQRLTDAGRELQDLYDDLFYLNMA